jgi:hypothetical protein
LASSSAWRLASESLVVDGEVVGRAVVDDEVVGRARLWQKG